MKNLNQLKKQIKQAEGKHSHASANHKTMKPVHTNQHGKNIISHSKGNR
ncbi:hypothetical protein BN1356_00899 [Streptococcus varani]|uniref:Uncharacterized protein n=1 Tax=Streptococcus varani TaxID=1608583 RepID=A0A0E4H458_9STRE|nr:hypothetical protein [Streptococcus varani]CQR24554.1 hypothetical protein BN1356_00899 [Streptococcus varani]